jgi:hypothetical protein
MLILEITFEEIEDIADEKEEIYGLIKSKRWYSLKHYRYL